VDQPDRDRYPGNPDQRPQDAAGRLRGTGGEYREKLISLAREARQRGWWLDYRDVLQSSYAEYIGLETEAAEIDNFQPSAVPGLLQTAAYARAMILGGLSEIGESEVERRVEVRMARQAILTRDVLGPHQGHLVAYRHDSRHVLGWRVSLPV
jgi:Domain of unknown function (DUF5753)